MKRKVTDLKPNEAILISNDSERDAILQLMEDAGMRWMNGAKLTELNPAFSYPFALETDNRYAIVFNEQLWDLPSHKIIPATDFIGSEFSGNGLTVSEPDNTISIEPSETIATLRAEKSELIEALKQIEQFSDIGDDLLALVRMKRIASQTLAKYETK